MGVGRQQQQLNKGELPGVGNIPAELIQAGDDIFNSMWKYCTGEKGTSSYTTGKRMGHIDRTGSGETALFKQTTNYYNHTRNHRATNGSKPNSKELNTKNNAEQAVGPGKGGTRPTTNHQCLVISGFYVSEPDKIVPFSQSMPTKQQTTNTTPTIEEEQMDNVLETIYIVLISATSLLRRISTGNTRLVPAPNEIMEVTMDVINTFTV